MAAREKRHSANSIPRMVFVGISLIFQIGWILVLILLLNRHSAWISLITSLLALTVVLKLYSKRTTANMKMPWIMLILTFPVMGLSLFLLIEMTGDVGRISRRLSAVREKTERALIQDEAVLSALDEDAAGLSCYLWQYAHSPVYANTAVSYFAEATAALESMKAALEKAEHFIFMEYFIIQDSAAFGQLLEILRRKAAQGVEIRVMYDDIGSTGYVNLSFIKRLKALGLQCRVFNPAVPVVNLFMNHRDHRKITVIDGKVGFTGGYNLADEYFDLTRPFGHWKDTGLRLEGEAVRSLTSVFLEMWSVAGKTPEQNPEKYLDIRHLVPQAAGFVQPYDDDPLGPERIAENACLNVIGAARQRLYLMTPYLIITEELSRGLELAAKRGVDVRVITPGIPDKKAVYAITRSYYSALASQGVRIYEYSPGFCHAKMWVCDGKIASVGTSNLDYRSLYHHFENNVVLYGGNAVKGIEADFEALFPQCREVTEQYRSSRNAALRLWQCVLRLFAPLM